MQSTNSRHSDPRRVFQINEAVAAYRLSRSTLHKLMSAGKLRTVKVGGRRPIPVAPSRRCSLAVDDEPLGTPLSDFHRRKSLRSPRSSTLFPSRSRAAPEL